METQFVPYELAVKLKELGFNEKCFSVYDTMGFHQDEREMNILLLDYIKAPLWQQAFDWFRVYHGLDGYIRCTRDIGACFRISYINDKTNGRTFSCFKDTYEQARYACLEKLIELCK